MMELFDAILAAVSTVGFPIVVAGYCLHTLNGTMRTNTEMLIQLKELLKNLTGKNEEE